VDAQCDKLASTRVVELAVVTVVATYMAQPHHHLYRDAVVLQITRQSPESFNAYCNRLILDSGATRDRCLGHKRPKLADYTFESNFFLSTPSAFIHRRPVAPPNI